MISYAQVLLFFIVPPIFLMGGVFLKSDHPDQRDLLRGTFLLILAALVWTTPWDNYLVATGIWSYGPGRVLGTIGYVPLEEYAFFCLQTLMVGLWVYCLHRIFPIAKPPALKKDPEIPIAPDKGGLGKSSHIQDPKKIFANHSLSFSIALISLGVLWLGSLWMLGLETTRYMGLILVWALPVIGLQWWFGFHDLSKNRLFCFLSVFPPTLYLWSVDAWALWKKVWTITEPTITGWSLGILPIEEALFFFVTTVMVAQGLILFIAKKNWLFSKWPRLGAWLYGFRRGVYND